jgi:hypothetical protein
MNLRTLTDDELLRHAHNEFDPLTGTALEAELLRRFEEQGGKASAYEAPPVEDTDDMAEVLYDFGIDDPATLRKQLERIRKFDQAMQDLAEPLNTLQSLATTE